MIRIPALEYHVAHGCNLSCQQCSHYSNFHLAGSMPTPEHARTEYAAWLHRLRPKRFALLGGEPALNPHLVEHVRVARESWPSSKLMLVSNGFFLHRFPELPQVLVDTKCQLEISQHGTHADYLERFQEVKSLVWSWREKYPTLRIRIRQSHKRWMRQYNIVDGKPMPFDSKPEAAFKICMQKTCTQLHKSMLFKCPALAFFALLEKRLRLEAIPQWQLFRDYQACSPDATDAEVQTFVATGSIPQCGLCPSRRIPFHHPDPTITGTEA
jgi:organic radical activating enzyme